jgi:hypothetical protein
MAKPEIELMDCDTGYQWRLVEGDTLGIKEKILSEDPDTGDYTRLLKFPPGIEPRKPWSMIFGKRSTFWRGPSTTWPRRRLTCPVFMPADPRE